MRIRIILALWATASAAAQSYSTNGDEQLGAYIARAVEKNPAVRESFARYRAALQRLPQVSALPDPVVELTQFARAPETRVGPQTTMVGISQRFPWFGKLGDREKVAAKEAAVVAASHEADKAEVVRQIKSAYYDLAYIDTAAAVTGEDLELLRHYETLAEARYAQGVGLQQAALKLQAEITRGLNQLEIFHRQRVDAEAVLNNLMDQAVDTPLSKVTLPTIPADTVDTDQLYGVARRQRPEIEAAFLRIETDEKRIHLARKQYRPDFTVGMGLTNVLGRRDVAGRMMPPGGNGKNIYNVTVGFNLPIFRRKYDAGVLEAGERLVASKAAYRNEINQAAVHIRSGAFRLETVRRQMSLFENALLPQAEQALRAGEAAYATGSVAVLDLLDSERVLLEVRLGLAQLRADYMKTLAEIERATGAAFPPHAPDDKLAADYNPSPGESPLPDDKPSPEAQQ